MKFKLATLCDIDREAAILRSLIIKGGTEWPGLL